MSLFLTLDKSRTSVIECGDTLKNPKFIYNTKSQPLLNISTPSHFRPYGGLDTTASKPVL
jgi:hypothetical protein